MATLHCPLCEQTFDPDHSTAMPFCSERCRQLDLGRWLDERYTMPIEREEGDSSASGSAADED